MYNIKLDINKYKVSELMKLIKLSTDNDVGLEVKFFDTEGSINTSFYKDITNEFVRQCVKVLTRDFYDDEFAACNPTKTVDHESNEVIRLTSSDFILEFTFQEKTALYKFDAWKIVQGMDCCKNKPSYGVSSEEFTLCTFYSAHYLDIIPEHMIDYINLIERTNDYFEE